MKVIIDCDNTLGKLGHDIDDGLAILYFLASKKYELLGITTTFGNSDVNTCYENTVSFMKNIGREDIPVYKGCDVSDKTSAATSFLIDESKKHENNISIICLGSLKNIESAVNTDTDFSKRIVKLSIMGGITEKLMVFGKELKELNFSVAQASAKKVLETFSNIIISTANACLGGYMPLSKFKELENGSDVIKNIYSSSMYWFRKHLEEYGNEGIYLWDVLAVSALFEDAVLDLVEKTISPDETSLSKGNVMGSGDKIKVKVPVIKDESSYIDIIIKTLKTY